MATKKTTCLARTYDVELRIAPKSIKSAAALRREGYSYVERDVDRAVRTNLADAVRPRVVCSRRSRPVTVEISRFRR